MSATDIAEERKFIHEIASPIGAALLELDGVLLELKAVPESNPQTILYLERVFKALQKTSSLLKERRAVLIERGQSKPTF